MLQCVLNIEPFGAFLIQLTIQSHCHSIFLDSLKLRRLGYSESLSIVGRQMMKVLNIFISSKLALVLESKLGYSQTSVPSQSINFASQSLGKHKHGLQAVQV